MVPNEEHPEAPANVAGKSAASTSAPWVDAAEANCNLSRTESLCRQFDDLHSRQHSLLGLPSPPPTLQFVTLGVGQANFQGMLGHAGENIIGTLAYPTKY
jgi:hypothetical protein